MMLMPPMMRTTRASAETEAVYVTVVADWGQHNADSSEADRGQCCSGRLVLTLWEQQWWERRFVDETELD